MPDTCIAKSPDCPTACPVMCGPDEMHCPGGINIADGCPMPDTCMRNDPMCGGVCPVQCAENEMPCPGGMDPRGCPMPDTCIAKSPDCPTACPVICGDNTILCPGDVDANGCPMPDQCMPFEVASICAKGCPMKCPEGEWPIWTGTDERGCGIEECSNGGALPFHVR